ncbi:MAG: M23 family metallopeptidase, partial [Dehalococcoidia bacterium]|nr:M23 family metallopeptidase [Dehalococcoidia bacterium]
MTKPISICGTVILPLILVLGSCSWPAEISTTTSLGASQAVAIATPTVAATSTPTPKAANPSTNAKTAATLTQPPIPTPSPTPTVDAQTLATRLRFTGPVKGAHVPEWLDLAPGAPRPYRGGIHEGVDFGFDAVGVTIRVGTPVVAAGDGVVIRADVNYQEPSPKEMDEMLARSQAIGKTTAENLDKLRGRQVWIDHGSGIVTRYAHLDRVAPRIAPGVRVSREQLIAYVGSSGVPGEGTGEEPHLHFEIRLGDSYLG